MGGQQRLRGERGATGCDGVREKEFGQKPGRLDFQTLGGGGLCYILFLGFVYIQT